MTGDLASIPELRELDSPRQLVRLPTEQNVPLTERVRGIIDTPEFQRLAQISQLGLVSRVYPGARHTRFEHALGVYHNALRYLQQLQRDPRFRELVDTPTAELLIVAALLHDLGHWPYCHPIEDLGIDGLLPHEANAAEFLGDGGQLVEVLDRQWGIRPDDVLDVLRPRSDSPRMRLLRSILSGPIDIDKMDYLERDSLHCGVPYGRHFDKQRLIQSLVLNERGDGLAITQKGRTAAELIVFARYVMFSEVYWHHAVRAATSMFARGFFELHDELDLPRLFRATDAEMVAELRSAARGGPCEQLFEGVFGTSRRLYKRALEFGHDDPRRIHQRLAQQPFDRLTAVARELAQSLTAVVGRRVMPADLLIDAPPPNREVEFVVDVLDTKTGMFSPLRRVSPVVDSLARTQFDETVKRVRLFVAPDLADDLRRRDELPELLDAAIVKTFS